MKIISILVYSENNHELRLSLCMKTCQQTCFASGISFHISPDYFKCVYMCVDHAPEPPTAERASKPPPNPPRINPVLPRPFKAAGDCTFNDSTTN